jgi:hypothetical protein
VNVIVLVGTEDTAAALGDAARALESDATRAAVFVGDVTTPDGRAALDEFVNELFDEVASPGVVRRRRATQPGGDRAEDP